jgi:hypothetical protein
MSLVTAIRNHRARSRDRRALENAIASAGSPAMRDELIIVSQRGDVSRGLR